MDVSFKGNTEAERAINLIKHTNITVFVTGKAGTGKSTLLRHIISGLKKKYILLAPTGIAALNISGQTIHSFFRFSFRPYLPNDRDLPNLSERVDLLNELDLIVIDEVSMVRADVMNAIDLTLKKALKNNLPFGGKQLLLVGDLLQLPPVINNRNLEEVKIIRESYANEFFFSAKVFENYDIEVIELQKVYRQKDVDFVNVLNNIRINKVDDLDLQRINSRLRIPNKEELDGVITLTTKNSKVDSINKFKLNNIPKKEHEFTAIKTGTFARNNSLKRDPTDTILKLKEGAQIIFLKNDSEKKWVNGTIGSISKINEKGIKVSVNKRSFYIARETWEDIEYKWNKEEDKVEKEIVGTFEQYPIRLAWAITIHKSQGQTFDKSIIDLDSGAFTFGQTYVALSRCTSINGIILIQKVTRKDIKVSQNAVRYLQEKGIDSLKKRDRIELSLTQTLTKFENDINEKEILTKDIIEEKTEIEGMMKYYEMELIKAQTENKFLKKEIERLKGISWIQKLFGTK